MNVIIAGAGPTGLTLGIELSRRGIRTIVLEKRKTPSNLSRAVGILASSMEVLAPSGAAAAIEREAVRFAGIRFHNGDRLLASFPLNFDDNSRLWGLAQDRTEAILAQTLEELGGTVKYGHGVTGFRQNDAGVIVTTAAGEFSGDYLAGCDGTHSTIRRILGLPFEGFELQQDWSIADVESHGWQYPQWFNGFLLPGGNVCVVVPLEAERFRVISSTPDALAALPVPMAVSNIRRSGTFRIQVRQVPRYGEGRIFLAGDAAHCHSPVGGRGMNLGISDAAFLARCLCGEEVLAGYGANRHAAGRHVIALSERARNIIQSRSPIVRGIAMAGMATASRIPPLARAAMRFAATG